MTYVVLIKILIQPIFKMYKILIIGFQLIKSSLIEDNYAHYAFLENCSKKRDKIDKKLIATLRKLIVLDKLEILSRIKQLDCQLFENSKNILETKRIKESDKIFDTLEMKSYGKMLNKVKKKIKYDIKNHNNIILTEFKTVFKNYKFYLNRQIDIINKTSKKLNEKFKNISENKLLELSVSQSHKNKKDFNETFEKNKKEVTHLDREILTKPTLNLQETEYETRFSYKRADVNKLHFQKPRNKSKPQKEKRKGKLDCISTGIKENTSSVSTKIKDKEENDSNEREIAKRLCQNMKNIDEKDKHSILKEQFKKATVNVSFNDPNNKKIDINIDSKTKSDGLKFLKIVFTNNLNIHLQSKIKISSLFNSTHKYEFFYRYFELFFEAQKKDKDNNLILSQNNDFFLQKNFSFVLDIHDLGMLKKYTKDSKNDSEIIVFTHVNKCSFAANMTNKEFDRIAKVSRNKKIPLFLFQYVSERSFLEEKNELILAISPNFKINHIKKIVKFGNVQVGKHIIDTIENSETVFDVNNPKSYTILSNNLVCLDDKTKFKCVPMDFKQKLSILYFLISKYENFAYHQVSGICEGMSIETVMFKDKESFVYFYFPSINMILGEGGCFDLHVLSVI
ncbi:hypothetical protein NUSPORA_00997 [Nucleospora cyclopteri]